jgi:nitrite reductase/ring-hydroxylating ferredoxin subunit
MGSLMRQYWQPVLLSSELPEPDGAPLRVRLLGEDLIAFRDTNGRVGLLGANCAHRGAPLFFGRNEDCGLRCVYHGWKYDVSGQCVDMPNVPPESTYKDKVRQPAYRCEESHGFIWAYMGTLTDPPPPPQFEFLGLPPGHRYISKQYLESNWVQSLEGDFDPTHSSFLHGSVGGGKREGVQDGTPEHALGDAEREARIRTVEMHALVMVIETEYGLLIGARRDAGQDWYWRLNQFVMPFYAYTPSRVANPLHCNIWQPMDDHTTMVWRIDYRLDRPLDEQEMARLQSGMQSTLGPNDYLPQSTAPGGAWMPKLNKHNEYMVDREQQRTKSYTGVRGIWAQDRSVTEGMGPIYDRAKEHLGPSDVGIIQLRRLLIESAQALHEHRIAPLGTQAGPPLIGPPIVFLPKSLSWEELAHELTAGRLVGV